MPWEAWVIFTYLLIDIVVTVAQTGKQVAITTTATALVVLTHVFMMYCVLKIA